MALYLVRVENKEIVQHLHVNNFYLDVGALITIIHVTATRTKDRAADMKRRSKNIVLSESYGRAVSGALWAGFISPTIKVKHVFHLFFFLPRYHTPVPKQKPTIYSFRGIWNKTMATN